MNFPVKEELARCLPASVRSFSPLPKRINLLRGRLVYVLYVDSAGIYGMSSISAFPHHGYSDGAATLASLRWKKKRKIARL